MSANAALDAEAQQLLALLVSKLAKANPQDPRTFLGYKEVHDILRLPQVRETYGESLKSQGLVSLADWTLATNKPGITGLVIDRTSMMPGKGYFDLFGKREDDFAWWMGEIIRSKAFDWSSYLPRPLRFPTAVDLDVATDRKETMISRIIRDTELARRIKELHNYECQLCGHTILLADGSRYAEAHHIQPLGEPHSGPDRPENLVCVCPNHHAELDFGARALALADLRTAPGHAIAEAYVAYHNTYVRKDS